MNVIGRLLFGKIRIVSFDPDLTQNGPEEAPPGSLWASLHRDEPIGPEPITYRLGPREGNLHQLQALEDSAFFDLLSPPYDPEDGRDCTYYAVQQADAVSSRCLLVPTYPSNFSMTTQHYQGPKCDLGIVGA